jgi:hypothetical protein
MDSAGEDERKGKGTPLFGRQSSLASLVRDRRPAGVPAGVPASRTTTHATLAAMHGSRSTLVASEADERARPGGIRIRLNFDKMVGVGRLKCQKLLS